MGLLVKARTATISEATRAIRVDELKAERVEMPASALPAEWAPQSGVWITWPHAGTDWAPMLGEVDRCYVEMAFRIAQAEPLIVVTPEPERVERLLREKLPHRLLGRIVFVEAPTDDTWTRDHGFLSVLEDGVWTLKDFCFNGWGNKFPSAHDNDLNRRVYASGWLKGRYENCLDFVLEGGSIESDGRGTLLTTAGCLFNPNRNPRLSAADIEERLKHEFHATRVLWLHHGYLEGDDTDGHIDTLARFCPADTIVYVAPGAGDDAQSRELRLMEEELRTFRTPDDEPYRLLALPMPDAVVCEGERLPATYANFLIMNGQVLMPTYGQPDNDRLAMQVLQKAFPTYSIIGIDCSVLVRQHGSLHCSTMQFPRGIVADPEEHAGGAEQKIPVNKT